MPEVVRDGVRLHYADVGSGPAVFFHTGGGGDGTMWHTAGYLDALPADVICSTTTGAMEAATSP